MLRAEDRHPLRCLPPLSVLLCDAVPHGRLPQHHVPLILYKYIPPSPISLSPNRLSSLTQPNPACLGFVVADCLCDVFGLLFSVSSCSLLGTFQPRFLDQSRISPSLCNDVKFCGEARRLEEYGDGPP